MSSSHVVRLQPRLRRFPEGVAAYRNGSPAACLDALYGHTDVPARVLRARALIRLGEMDGALGELATIDQSVLYNQSKGEVLGLQAVGLTVQRRFPEAREALDLARVFTFGSSSAALESEYHFFESTWHFAKGDLAATDAAACMALAVAPAYLDRHSYFVAAAHSVARALAMRGLVASAGKKFSDHAAFLREAVALARTWETPDLWIYASLLKQLAFHVRDFDLVDDGEMLRNAMLETAAWPSDLAPMQCEIYRALGWSSALRGDHLRAFGAFRKAAAVAPTSAWKILACIDRAFLTRELGERNTAREELDHATHLAHSVRWETIGEERIGLALLAQEVAAYDPGSAAALHERYERIATPLSPLAANASDPRVRAYEAFAKATVLRANASGEAAETAFATAFEIWERLDYRWLAARAALELCTSGSGAFFKQYAAREAALRPHSWLAGRVRALEPGVGAPEAGVMRSARVV